MFQTQRLKVRRNPPYSGFLNIPEGASGAYKIKHERKRANEPVMISNWRNRILAPTQDNTPLSVQYDAPTIWHRLEGPTGTWMTDYPIEQAQHDAALACVGGGRVLVGGLGLGYAATLLARNPSISSVVVVELSQDVISLVEPAMRANLKKREAAKIEVVNDDLFNFLRQCERPILAQRFNYAFYDIWQSDGEQTFHGTVVPLLKLSQGVVSLRPICWNEDVMRGQLYTGLVGRLLRIHHAKHIDKNGKPEQIMEALTTPEPEGEPRAIWINWSLEFFRWVRDKKPDQEHAQVAAQFFALIYGESGWERVWQHAVAADDFAIEDEQAAA